MARFARTLGTLTASGVPILQALDITAKTAGNRVISDPMVPMVGTVYSTERAKRAATFEDALTLIE